MGAQELRHGTPDPKPVTRSSYLEAMTIGQNFTFTDLDERWVLTLSNRTLHAIEGRHDDGADVTLTLPKSVLHGVVDGSTTFADAVAAGDAQATGDVAATGAIFDHLDVFMNFFKLVEP